MGGQRLGGGKGYGHYRRQRAAETYHAAGSRDDDPESDKITCPNRAQEGAGGETQPHLFADALHRRYGAIATEHRQAEGKDTGRVRFLDAGFEISADLPKRVEWDQARLAAAIATLRSWGEDPADYVATEIKVAESRFTAWPPKLQALFQPARTVGTGRPSYSLEQVEW